MKAQRLLAITMLLLNRDSISAPELARRFEVSVRTIYRDIESLCEAGIPVAAYPGAGGGFGIVDSFRIDRSLLKPDEIGQVSATLETIASVFGDQKMRQAGERLKALGARSPSSRSSSRPATGAARKGSSPVPENYLFIELNPGRRDREKIGRIRRAIEERRILSLGYVDGTGAMSERRIEPLAIVFLWHAWYLYAFCRSRQDFRLFKIARMSGLELCAERFEPRCVDLDSRPWNDAWAENEPFYPAVIRFRDAARIDEFFEAGSIEREEGGSAIVRTSLPCSSWTTNYLLGLGIAFAVLEPAELRQLVAERASLILQENSK